MTETTLSPNVTTPLVGLARRLRDDPAYMAYVLVAYQQQERLTDDALAAQLELKLADLVRLAICKRPEIGSPQFADQVRQIAAYLNIDTVLLAQMIRQVDSLEQLSKRPKISRRGQPHSQPARLSSGVLAAARDRNEAIEDGDNSTQTTETPKDE